MINKFELNPFEIKAEITKIILELDGISDFENYETRFKILDSQTDKSLIVKLLFKEINNSPSEAVKFLLMRYCPEDELTEKLWGIIKSNLSSNKAKIFALDALRDTDSGWSYDECGKYLENPNEFLDADTRKILNNAISNPEVQIDFMDFLSSIPEDDKIILLESLGCDYSQDELANMLIPVFLSMPNSKTGKKALEILGNSKSQLACHALNYALDFADEAAIPVIKKNLALLKLSGIREDNSKEFYKNLLKDSKPYKFCITYPDGHGNQAIIISRINEYGKVRFCAVVIDDYNGIRDCFGFNEITRFECNAIIERFYRGQRAINIPPSILKSLLADAEKLSKNKMPYEYICWRNLLADIEEAPLKLNYKITKLTTKDFQEILQYDFINYWFMDENYSDEFEDFIKLLKQTEPQNYEELIDENLEKIFYNSEYNLWSDRILKTALLKDISGDKKTAQNLYSLYNNKELKREFFKNIIRKSIYEYYFLRQNVEKIQAIEKMWVK